MAGSIAGHPGEDQASRARASTRLDHATKLVKERRDLWVLKLYPDAGEAGGSFRWVGRGVAPEKSRCGDPERAREVAERRARGKLRRYVVANDLRRLISCTYEGPGQHDARALRVDVGGFFRRLRYRTGGKQFSYAWVGEWHATGHGLHVHAGIGGYVPKGVVADAWGHGFIDIRLLGKRVAGVATLAEARRAAGYLNKYVGKSLGEGLERGLHRYEVAQGFQPRSIEFVGLEDEQVLEQASEYMGLPPEEVWRSDPEDWDGPPALWVAWSSTARIKRES